MPLRFLLFDHDGVLVDTERWYFEATRQILATVGAELDQETFLDFNHRAIPNWKLAEDRGLSTEQIDELRNQRNVVYQQLIQEREIEIEGVREVTRALSENYRLAIVTTARRCDFDLIHRERDLVDPFEFVLTVGDYPRPKPQPDPYLAALERFGSKPEEAIAIEDTARGLKAAVAANLRCVIVRNEFSADEDFSEATVVLDSIRDLPATLRAL